MALEYGFYDSYNHDRLYNAENMNDIFEGVLTDGVYAGVGELFAVKPSYGLQVTVGTGRAWFKMTWNKNRTMAPVNLDQPDPVYDRIDTVCIRVQKNILERRNDFFVYKGAVLTDPQPPTLVETDETFFLPLANVRVRANSEEIKPSDIEMLVGRERCPFVTSILQQTDITTLFLQWQAQFEEWWEGVKEILNRIEQGDLGALFSEIALKVNISDKATAEDVTYNSDSKWMTPARTKEMIDSAVDTSVGAAVSGIQEQLKSGVVNSFKGRKGAVVPQAGDYTPEQVGALPRLGGTINIDGSETFGIDVGTLANGSKNYLFKVDMTDIQLLRNASVGGSLSINGGNNLSVSGGLTVNGATTLNATTIQNGLRLKSATSNYGQVLNFGNGDTVHISEPTDDNMEIKASSVNFVLSGSATGSSNTNFKINGADPFAQIKALIPSSKSGLSFSSLGSSTLSTSTSAPTSTSVNIGSARLVYVICRESTGYKNACSKLVNLSLTGSDANTPEIFGNFFMVGPAATYGEFLITGYLYGTSLSFMCTYSGAVAAVQSQPSYTLRVYSVT